MPGEIARGVAVYPDLEGVSRAAAELFAVEARRAAELGRDFNVLLPGGQTPRRCYQLLGEEPLRGSVPWQVVRLFWGDERHVPYDDPRSNFGSARPLLQRLPLGEAQLHPIPCQGSARDSAFGYERTLRTLFPSLWPRFDLAFLGMGEDGHTASLFPGSPALRESERWVCEVTQGDLERVTLTAPLINHSAVIVFLVTGRAKAAVLQQVLEGEYHPLRLPAQLIHPEQGTLLFVVDEEAASLLRDEDGPEDGDKGEQAR